MRMIYITKIYICFGNCLNKVIIKRNLRTWFSSLIREKIITMKCVIIFIFHLNHNNYARNMLLKQAVKNFLYENCTSILDTFMEFCTGHDHIKDDKLVPKSSHIQSRKYQNFEQ